MQFFFRILPGRPPTPLLPVDRDRKPQVPSDTIMLLPDAAKASGHSEQHLKDLWMDTWGQFIESDDSPLAGKADAPATPSGADADRMDEMRHLALRTMLFPHLSDEHFDVFLQMCRVRGLNPWAKQVYAKIDFDRRIEQQVVQIIVGIEGMRIIAHRTGQFAGCDEIVFEHDGNGMLEKATATVYRLSGEKRFAYKATVYWKEYAPLGDDQFYSAMPCVSLGRDAEAAALRKAFPQELGGIYTPEELRRMDGIYQRRTESALDEIHAEPKAPALAFAPPDSPRTYDQFLGELENLGIESEEDRVKLIRHFRDRKMALAEQSPPAFWKLILEEVRKDPQRWGAKAAEIAA